MEPLGKQPTARPHPFAKILQMKFYYNITKEKIARCYLLLVDAAPWKQYKAEVENRYDAHIKSDMEIKFKMRIYGLFFARRLLES